MARFHHSLITLLAAAALLGYGGAAGRLSGQDVGTEAQSALAACAAAEGTAAERKRAADEAEREYRARLREHPGDSDLRVGLAQVLVRCQLPHAGVTGVMSIIGAAEAELRAVLAERADHWNAAFTLAMLLRNMPPMLGRGDDAVREFERLIAQQGDRADRPGFALPFVHLGDLHEQAVRRTAAIEVWRRGLTLFPDHAELRSRLERAGAPVAPDSAWLASLRAREPQHASGIRDSEPAVYAFAPLRVDAVHHQFQEARAGTTLRRLDVYTMPGGTGEMLQALQAMPGATRAGDGAELYVRGGDPAETPVFFDGGRVAFPGRWESLQGSAMGVVDAAILRRAFFSCGGFSARYGNALSGIVDVETEGRPARAMHRYGVNLVQAGTTLRAPVGERLGVWGTLSGTDTRLITRMNGESDYTRAPQSVQGVAGLVFEPASGIELRSTVLAVGDRFGRRFEMNGHEGSFDSSSGMQHLSIGVQAVRADGRRGVRGNLTASRRTGGMRFGVLDREREDRAAGGRIDGDVVLGSSLRVRSGVELLRYEALAEGTVPTSPDLAPGAPSTTLTAEPETALHAGAYVEVERATGSGLALVAGLRVDDLPGESGVTLDPRLGAAWSSGEWTVRAGAGVFRQGRWRARYRLPDPGQPAGTPTRAEHVVVGAEKTGMLSVRVEGYLKRYGDYVAAGDGPPLRDGTSSGIDAIARWSPRSGPTGWVSWSLLRGRVTLLSGESLPSALDVTHSLTGVLRFPVGAHWELGTTGRYASGKPFTPVLGRADEGLVHGAVHSERLPEYRRFDARMTRYFLAPQRTALIYLEMLNLLDRRNVMNYTYDDAGAQRVPIHTVFAHRTFVLGFELQFN